MAKIVETLRKVRSEEPDAKIIMFCQWEKILKFIAKVLVELGEPAPLVLRGTMCQRQSTIRNFVGSNEPEHSVLLLSLEKSPTGMNLVSCHHLFLVHPMFAQTKERAVAFELQAIGRLRRHGQQKHVIVHRFVTQGTVEDDLTARHKTHLDEVDEKQRAEREGTQKDKGNATNKKVETTCATAKIDGKGAGLQAAIEDVAEDAAVGGDDEAGSSEVRMAVQCGL